MRTSPPLRIHPNAGGLPQSRNVVLCNADAMLFRCPCIGIDFLAMIILMIIGAVHVFSGVVCLILGALIFLNTKGTRFHRTLGNVYVLAMLLLNVTALCIYRLTGHFNLFHLFALLSLIMVFVGWIQVYFRRHFKRWFYRHYVYMCWSYAGLVAATSNEAFVRVPALKAIVHRTGNWVILAAQIAILGACALLLSLNRTWLHERYDRLGAT
jgi:uncharacterized membrane protein